MMLTNMVFVFACLLVWGVAGWMAFRRLQQANQPSVSYLTDCDPGDETDAR